MANLRTKYTFNLYELQRQEMTVDPEPKPDCKAAFNAMFYRR